MADPQLPDAPLLGQALPVELMNTFWSDRHGVHDSLGSLGDARRWVTAVSPRLDAPVRGTADALDDGGLGRLRDLRDAVRRIAAERTGDPREQARSPMADLGRAVQTVNDSARLAQIRPMLELTEGGGLVGLPETTGAPDALFISAIAGEAIELFGPWDDLDLRACLAPGCVLYFIKDHPRREWCSNGCGNRARAARHYARHGRVDEAE
ncbi:ABATE domain-containing protein [Agromyces sp. H66]|uniref:ABATE domain-containing protein n=1 Tax=Agromyces sp. H66 TaxID=2529859 RepID=UPI0010A9C868|nr:ABATE domain-containing protein [Agromyces sp. H66]